MKKKKKWLKWVIVLVIAVVFAAWLMMFSKGTQSAVYTDVQAVTGNLETYYNFDGLVKAKRTQTITSAQAGTVRTVYVRQNEQVKKGAKLYRLDDGETVQADMAGEVTGLYIEEGSVVSAGETTAQIIDMSSLEAELKVDEYDVAAVTPGMPVQISVLATGGQFTGNGTASGDLSYYTAAVALESGEGVYPGMQISAKILREKAENAVLLRQDAIQFDEYNKPYVYMRGADGKEVVQVGVSVGASDGIYCEITDGLKAGDTVLKPSGMSMAELMQQMQAQSH